MRRRLLGLACIPLLAFALAQSALAQYGEVMHATHHHHVHRPHHPFGKHQSLGGPRLHPARHAYGYGHTYGPVYGPYGTYLADGGILPGGGPHYRPPEGPAGGPVGTYAYPYYTLRGPRDFLLANPPSIGPY
jgi:hypothetical protein